MYRNCVYNNREKKIYLWTWDSNGERIKEEHDFKPYILLEDKNGTDKSIYGTKLKKKCFNSSYDRNQFVKDSNIKRIYENLPPYQQFLIDNYWSVCEDDNFSQYPLKICFIDIECPANPNINNGRFPEPELAEQVINLIVCHNSLNDEKVAFGLKAFYGDGVKYIHNKSEKELLKTFVKYMEKEGFDVFCGWNSNGFDIPYLINRITFELGKEWADRLSPIGRIYEKINKAGRYGEPTKEYVIEGVSCIDYMIIYKKFSQDKQDSYRLDNIGEVELRENKIEYDGSLWDLARDDWDTFVKYCIKDVDIVVNLNKKLDYISLLRFLAYTSLCSLENAIKTVPPMNGAIAIRARHRNEYIPTFIKPISDESAPGGFVAEPKIGISENVVSFDANSLYPSVMITLNISPETKIGRVEKIGDIIKIHHTSGRIFELSRENFAKFIKEENAALSKAGILFSQKHVGLIPEFLDNLYSKRKEMKRRMIDAKKIGDEELAKKYDRIQYAYKIHLNSMYGYTLEKHAPIYDIDIGSSVTLTGQAVTKKSISVFHDYVKEFYPEISEDDIKNGYIYSDTDSLYLSLKFVDSRNIKLKNADTISSEFLSVCDHFEDYLNDHMNEWARKELRSKDPRFVYKRESICDSSLFISGKNYILHTLNLEGVDVNKFKYVGNSIGVTSTEFPKKLKPQLKEIINNMVISKNRDECNNMFNKFSKEFRTLTPTEIAKTKTMKGYEEYSSKCNGFTTTKGMPNHVKSAYYYNLIIEKEGLAGKYEKLKSGDKVKIVYVKKHNKYNIEYIAFPNKWPKEFDDIFEVDFDKMFDKTLYSYVDRFYKTVGWKLRKPSENVTIELDELFGEG